MNPLTTTPGHDLAEYLATAMSLNPLFESDEILAAQVRDEFFEIARNTLRPLFSFSAMPARAKVSVFMLPTSFCCPAGQINESHLSHPVLIRRPLFVLQHSVPHFR